MGDRESARSRASTRSLQLGDRDRLANPGRPEDGHGATERIADARRVSPERQVRPPLDPTRVDGPAPAAAYRVAVSEARAPAGRSSLGYGLRQSPELRVPCQGIWRRGVG